MIAPIFLVLRSACDNLLILAAAPDGGPEAKAQ